MTLNVEAVSQPEQVLSVVNHPVFRRASDESPISMADAQWFVDQFWHPSHYFPRFLASLIGNTPDLATQTQLSRILWQELGCGSPSQAHESIYRRDLIELGFADPARSDNQPAEETQHLVDCFRLAGTEYLAGLGCIYATETVDLSIVSGLGGFVSRATGSEMRQWVGIHELQEDDHMESAGAAIEQGLGDNDATFGNESANRTWAAWETFYDGVEQVLARHKG